MHVIGFSTCRLYCVYVQLCALVPLTKLNCAIDVVTYTALLAGIPSSQEVMHTTVMSPVCSTLILLRIILQAKDAVVAIM